MRYNHPMLLLGLFFEIERKRLDKEVEDLVERIDGHLRHCGALDLDKQALDLDRQTKATITENLNLASDLTKRESLIKAVKQQLLKFQAEVSKLEPSKTNLPSQFSVSSLTLYPPPNEDEGYCSQRNRSTMAAGQESQVSDTMLAAPTSAARCASQKIQERTDDMIADLDEWLNDCISAKANLSLAMTTVSTLSSGRITKKLS